MLVRISGRSFAPVAPQHGSRPGRLRSAVAVRPVAAERSWLISHEAMVDPPLAVAAEMTWPVTSILHETGPLRVVGPWRAHRQDSRDSTSGPVPAAMRRGCARALRTAPGGLNGGETCPLMLVQQPAKLGVLRPQERLRVVHITMIGDRDAARQDGPARGNPRDHLIRRAGRAARDCPGGGRLPGPYSRLVAVSRWLSTSLAAGEHPLVPPPDWRLTRCLEGRFAQRVSLPLRT